MAKEELLALSLAPDYRLECDICDRDYMYMLCMCMLRRGCPCFAVLWGLGEACAGPCCGLAPKADGATN